MFQMKEPFYDPQFLKNLTSKQEFNRIVLVSKNNFSDQKTNHDNDYFEV